MEGSRSRAYCKLVRTRSRLLLRHPFFASLAMRLRLHEDKTCRSAWTDGNSLSYNPDYINALSEEKLLGLTAHLVMHPACGHHLRRGDRDFKRWNEACDYAINPLLVDAGFTLPETLSLREEFYGMGAEEIYTSLSGENSQEREEENESEGEEESDQRGDEKKEQEEGKGEDEEMAAGEVRDAPSPDGKKEQGKGESSSGSITEWDEAFLSAASQAKAMGKLPAGIDRLVEKKLRPHLPWPELLARFMERTSRSDYSWVMPNRRYLHLGLYLPSLLENELQQIAVALDVSGSIDDATLQSFINEIAAIMDQMPSSLSLLCCDADIQFFRQFIRADFPVSIRDWNLQGGGGTDFRPVFAKIEQEQLAPSCLIYLSDMECLLYPEHAPSYPVLWVKSGVSGTPLPPFGEYITMQ